jgi:hypothetical protein
MRETGRAPSIVPKSDDDTVYLVLDNLGRPGRIWPEVDAETTDLETVILDLLEGQYKDPVRVIGFNTAEGWSQDISVDVAHELRHRGTKASYPGFIEPALAYSIDPAAIGGSTRSSSTATGFRSTSPTRAFGHSPAGAMTGPSASRRSPTTHTKVKDALGDGARF